MYLILFVLNDPDKIEQVLDAWEQAGVGGVTILPSTGLGRIRQKEGLRDDLPLLPSLTDFYRHDADISHTLFSLVETEELADRVIEATEQAVGDLEQPGNGILAVLPVARLRGLTKHGEQDK